jgi:hypothetical protein
MNDEKISLAPERSTAQGGFSLHTPLNIDTFASSKDFMMGSSFFGESVEEMLQRLREHGTSIHFEKDSCGNLVSLVAIGQSFIPYVSSEFREIATSVSKQAATWEAFAVLSSWLNGNVSPRNETESADIASATTVSDLHLLGFYVDIEHRLVTVAFGWKPSLKNNSFPQLSVRVEKSFEENSMDASERIIKKIWVDGVLVIHSDSKISEFAVEQHYRQWHASGLPSVDVLIKEKEVSLRMAGAIWSERGIRIQVAFAE